MKFEVQPPYEIILSLDFQKKATETGQSSTFQNNESPISRKGTPVPTKIESGAPASEPNGSSDKTSATPFGSKANGTSRPEQCKISAKETIFQLFQRPDRSKPEPDG